MAGTDVRLFQGKQTEQPPPFSAPNWTDVVANIQRGQDSGMRELYAAFGGGVKLLFTRALGRQDADDRVHDTFLIVIRAIQAGEVRDPDKLMSFVRTIVRRQIAAWIGNTVRSRRDQVEVDTTFADSRRNPEETAIGTQQKLVMRQLLRELSRRDLEVLTRFYLNEETPDEICRQLGLTPKQFQLLKSRAKARFVALANRRLR
jgi:RNA polymerase sigma-70 factor, ECF subfamily